MLAIPFRATHSDEIIFEVVRSLMNGLCTDTSEQKLLSVATDGASNMTGWYKGALTRFAALPLPGFYHVWCVAHQLDLVIQSIMFGLLKTQFWYVNLSLSAEEDLQRYKCGVDGSRHVLE